MLSSALLQRDGETMLVFCLVDKTEDGSVVLSETYGKADSTFYNLEPFYRLWGLPLNDETGRLGDAEFGPKSAKKPGSRLSPG